MIDALSPLMVLFAVTLLGYALGKLKIFGITLDLSAILLVAILFGFLISHFLPMAIDTDFSDSMSVYSRLGTSLFVSVIGITSGISLKLYSKKTVLYLFLGCLAVLIGFTVVTIIGYIDTETDKSVLLGILSGALTSTPALSAISERPDVISENAIIGYGAAYILGVVIVVVSTQIMGKIVLKTDVPQEQGMQLSTKNSMSVLALIAVTALAGDVLGRLSLWGYSIGTTGAILIFGIAIGCIIRKRPHIRYSVEQCFSTYRTLGLVLFFVGNGITAGAKLNSNISIKWFIYGAIMTFVSVVSVLLICKIIVRNTAVTPSLIAGSLTSTPALGVLIKKEYAVDFMAYFISYVGALLTMTVGIKFI